MDGDLAMSFLVSMHEPFVLPRDAVANLARSYLAIFPKGEAMKRIAAVWMLLAGLSGCTTPSAETPTMMGHNGTGYSRKYSGADHCGTEWGRSTTPMIWRSITNTGQGVSSRASRRCEFPGHWHNSVGMISRNPLRR